MKFPFQGSRLVALALTAALMLTTLVARAALPTVPVASAPASIATPAAGVGIGGLLQAGLGMACVVGLILACAWLARRFGLQRFGGGQLVKVVSSTAVGQRERVVVVEVNGQWLVLGVTPQNINTLHTLPAQANSAPATAAGAEMNAFAIKRPAEPLAHVTQATQAFSHLLRQSLGIKPRTLP
jgi:flagellar protein FliO/FliZ